MEHFITTCGDDNDVCQLGTVQLQLTGSMAVVPVISAVCSNGCSPFYYASNSLPAASYLILTSQVNETSQNDLSILTLEPIKSHF